METVKVKETVKEVLILLKEPFTSISNTYYKAINRNYNSIYVCTTLHGNCQTYSIGQVNEILRYDKEERIELFKKCQAIGNKNQVLVDINRENEAKLEGCFPKEHIVFKQRYENANKSSMSMYLIRTDTLK